MRFPKELRDQIAKFAWALHPEKTGLIEIGRSAASYRAAPGFAKAERAIF
jgi:hypothetical protein